MKLRFGHRRPYGLLLLASLLACEPFKADTCWMFSDATYSGTTVATPPTPAELHLQVFSALELGRS